NLASANGTTPASSASSSASASAAPAALPPGATVSAAGFPTMPFTFDFQGSFFSMQHFLRALDDLTTVDGKTIKVKGPLLTGGSSSAGAPAPTPTRQAAVPAAPNGLADHRDAAREAVITLDQQAAGPVDRSGKVRNPFIQLHVPKAADATQAVNAAVQATKDL